MAAGNKCAFLSSQKVKRAALTAIGMIPSESSRALFNRFLEDKDDGMRGAAAEGFAEHLENWMPRWPSAGMAPKGLSSSRRRGEGRPR